MTDPMGRPLRPLTELRGYIPEPDLRHMVATVFTEFTRGFPPEPTLPQPLLLTPSRGYVSLSRVRPLSPNLTRSGGSQIRLAWSGHKIELGCGERKTNLWDPL